MIQLKIAFLDEEEEYLKQLRGYLVRRKEMFFKVFTFCNIESFLKVKEEIEFDGIVMTNSFWEKLKTIQFKGKRIFLYENEEISPRENCVFVNKYQSAEQLFCQISGILWQEETEQKSYFTEKMAELIAVYSPINYEGQMAFSMTLAQILSQHQNVLYVNLMEHSGFYEMTKAAISEDIGDLFYGLMQQEHDFHTKLHSIRKSYRDFDYIPPAVNPEHLSEISKSLYEQLFMYFKSCSGYDVVIVDFERTFLGFAEMLPIFSKVYCLGKEGIMNRYRMKEFLEYLEKESTKATGHIQKLLLSERWIHRDEINPIESCLYGSMGDYIRGCLQGGLEVEG